MTYIYWLIDKYMRCRAVLVYIRQLIDEYKWDLEVGVSLFSVRLAPVLILTPAATAALLVPPLPSRAAAVARYRHRPMLPLVSFFFQFSLVFN
jgi:hypothetical protein